MAKHTKNLSSKRDNTVKGREVVLILHTSVCVGRAYKVHTRESHYSSKPKSQILGYAQAAMHLDLMG